MGCAALGSLVLVLIALQTIRASMLADRQTQINSMVNFAGKLVGSFLAYERAGTLTRNEAQAKAKLALSSPAGLRGNNNRLNGVSTVREEDHHPVPRFIRSDAPAIGNHLELASVIICIQ